MEGGILNSKVVSNLICFLFILLFQIKIMPQIPPNSSVQKFRAFLTLNKIFIESVVAVLLSAMALVVSCNANKIAQAQTKIMEVEHIPKLELRMHEEFNEKKKIYDNNVWMVYNKNGKLITTYEGNMTVDDMLKKFK